MADNKKEATLILRLKEMVSDELEKVQSKIEDIGKYSAIAFAAFSAVIVKSISDLREEEQATQQLNQAMINAGVYTSKLSDEYAKMASNIQKNSLYGDELVKQSQAIIQSQIGNRQVTEQLMKATVDLAAAQRIDLATAAEMVGKSIGTSTNALARQGIELNDNMTKQQKMDAIISQINRKWEGQAEAQTKGLGSLVKMKNAFSDLMEALGAKFSPMIEKLAKVFTGLFDKISGSEPILNLIAIIVSGGAAVSGFVAAVSAMAVAFIAANTAAAAFGLTVGALLGPITAVAVAIGAVGGAIGYFLTQSNTATNQTAALKDEISDTEQQLAKLQAQMDRGVGSIGIGQMQVYAIEAERVKNKLAELKKQETVTAVAEETSKQSQVKSIRDSANAQDLKDYTEAQLKKAETTKMFQDFDMQNRQIDHELRMAQFAENEGARLVATQEAEIARLSLASSYMQQLIDKENDTQKKLTLIKQQESLKQEINERTSQKNQTIANNEEEKKRLANRAEALSMTASLQNSSNKHLAALGKAAALTQLAIDGPMAIGRALGSAPPPFNFALAAGVAAAMASQVANVTGVPLAQGGIVMPRPGGTQATIGEAGQAEAVIPLDRAGEFGLGGGGTTIMINVQGGMLGSETEAREFALAVDKELLKLRRNNESVSFDSGVI